MRDENHFSVVAFDMDGLIFDTEALSKKAFLYSAREFGITVEEDYYKRFVGHSQPYCDQLMYDKFGADFDAAGFRSRWWQTVSEIFDDEGVEFKPGFHALFDKLKTHAIPLALVTTSSYQTVLRNFKGWDYPQDFDTLITWDRGLPAKPAPDKYLAAAEDLRSEAKDMLVLEDSITGMQAAINAKCKAVMVPDLVEPDAHIQANAFKIFASLHNVNQWVVELLE